MRYGDTRSKEGDAHMVVSLPVRLRALRAARGWTLEQAAEEAGLTPDNLSKIEKGHRKPRVSTLSKLADAYGVAPEELLSLEEPVVAGKDEASQEGAGRTVYRFGDGPEVTAEALREHGIEVNNSEIILLNQYIHLHKHPPKGIHATGYVRKEGEPVDRERVKTLLAYVLASNMLTEAERGAVRETIEQELAATS
jgi:transcriptional regulator with XRE-family HTH domain